MNDLIEINNRLKIRIKQLEATIDLCEIKMKASEANLCKKSNILIGRDKEIINLKSDQNHMQDELKKLQLQNKIMNNELNQTLIRPSSIKRPTIGDDFEENLNKFIVLDQHQSNRTNNLNKFSHQKQINKRMEIVKKINVFNK